MSDKKKSPPLTAREKRLVRESAQAVTREFERKLDLIIQLVRAK